MKKIDVNAFKKLCKEFTNEDLATFYRISLGTLHNWKKKYGCLKEKGRPKIRKGE